MTKGRLTLDRRTFLKLTAMTAGAVATGCAGRAWTRPEAPSDAWPDGTSPTGDAFPMGVQAGDPTPGGGVLWTRYVGDGALTLVVGVWDGRTWSEPLREAVTPAEAGYVKVDVVDLPEGAWLAYQFVDDAGGASPVGRMVAAPPEDALPEEVVLGATSCLDQDHEAFPALTHLAGRGPLDAMLFLGDTAYFDRVPTEADAFRALYAQNLTAPGFADLLPTVATLFQFDDHEFINDFDRESISDERYRMGLERWLENLPVREDEAHPDRVWRRVRFGRTVEVFVTDTRTERRPSEGRIVSPEQLAWLKEGLASSDAVWKIVATAVPFADFTGSPWDIPGLIEDKWAGFPDQQQELVDHLDAWGLDGVLFVSGDVHCGYLARVAAEGPGARFFDLCCGPSGSFLNTAVRALPDGERFYFGLAEWHATRLTLRADGTADVVYVGEADEDLVTLTIDTAGEVLSLEALDPGWLESIF